MYSEVNQNRTDRLMHLKSASWHPSRLGRIQSQLSYNRPLMRGWRQLHWHRNTKRPTSTVLCTADGVRRSQRCTSTDLWQKRNPTSRLRPVKFATKVLRNGSRALAPFQTCPQTALRFPGWNHISRKRPTSCVVRSMLRTSRLTCSRCSSSNASRMCETKNTRPH